MRLVNGRINPLSLPSSAPDQTRAKTPHLNEPAVRQVRSPAGAVPSLGPAAPARRLSIFLELCDEGLLAEPARVYVQLCAD